MAPVITHQQVLDGDASAELVPADEQVIRRAYCDILIRFTIDELDGDPGRQEFDGIHKLVEVGIRKARMTCSEIVEGISKPLQDLRTPALEFASQVGLVLAQQVDDVFVVARLRADMAEKRAVLVGVLGSLVGRSDHERVQCVKQGLRDVDAGRRLRAGG